MELTLWWCRYFRWPKPICGIRFTTTLSVQPLFANLTSTFTKMFNFFCHFKTITIRIESLLLFTVHKFKLHIITSKNDLSLHQFNVPKYFFLNVATPGRSLIYSLFKFHFSYVLSYLLWVKYNNMLIIFLSMSFQIGVHHLIVFETNQFILSRVP